MSANPTDYQHPAVAAVATISAGLDAFGDASLWSMSTADVGQLVVAMERVARRVSAAQVSALAQADRSGVADQTGASSTAVWLHNVTDLPVGIGRARLALHHALANRPVVVQRLARATSGQRRRPWCVQRSTRCLVGFRQR